MTEPRFYVFECEASIHGSGPVLVVDRAWNHRVVASLLERSGAPDALGRAHRLADRLNEEDAAACQR